MNLREKICRCLYDTYRASGYDCGGDGFKYGSYGKFLKKPCSRKLYETTTAEITHITTLFISATARKRTYNNYCHRPPAGITATQIRRQCCKAIVAYLDFKGCNE